MNLDISVGSIADGYPCPKDGTTLELIEGKGAWCSTCHTVWTEVDEVTLDLPGGGCAARDTYHGQTSGCIWPSGHEGPHRFPIHIPPLSLEDDQ